MSFELCRHLPVLAPVSGVRSQVSGVSGGWRVFGVFELCRSLAGPSTWHLLHLAPVCRCIGGRWPLALVGEGAV